MEICTDCIGKYNYQKIKAITAPSAVLLKYTHDLNWQKWHA